MTNFPDQPPKKPAGVTLPGVDTFTTVHRHATRRLNAVERTPVGKRILNVIRNLAWVVPLTILVWLYAEREQLDRQRDMAVSITVVSERADRVVEVVRPEDHTILVDMEGSRARIEQARQELTSRQGIQLVLPGSIPIGTQVPLPALEAIATNRVFLDRGITVTSVKPATLTLNVDEVIDMELRPQVSREIMARADNVVFDPPVVKVSGPRSVLMDRAAPIEVIADLTEQMLPKVPGDQEINGVALRSRTRDERVRISPSTVKATVRVKASTTSYVISSVAVFTMTPQGLLDRYQVDFGAKGPFITNVTVVGPEDEINRIKSNEFIPKAVLEVKPEDARSPLPRAPSMYVLPPGVEVSEGDRSRTVTFELVERSRGE